MEKHNSGGVVGIEKHTLAERDTEKLHKSLPTVPLESYTIGLERTLQSLEKQSVSLVGTFYIRVGFSVHTSASSLF